MTFSTRRMTRRFSFVPSQQLESKSQYDGTRPQENNYNLPSADTQTLRDEYKGISSLFMSLQTATEHTLMLHTQTLIPFHITTATLKKFHGI